MLETSARLLRLLSLLQTRQDWTGPGLAERLGVTSRTIRNDIDRLRNLGYPVHATPGVAGGYRLGAGSSLPPLLLDDDEAVAVAIGLRTAAGEAVSGIEESAVRALAKLDHVLPSRLRERVGAVAAGMVSTPAHGPPIDADTLATIATACRDHQRLTFEYADHNQATSTRVTEPHRVVHTGRRWYVVAWDVDRDDWRTFRVDRVTLRKSPLGRRFAPRQPPGGDAGEFLERGVATSMWRYQATVTVCAPAEVLAARLPSAVHIEPLDASHSVVRVGSETPQMLALYVGMIGADFTIDPDASPELAEHLLLLADRYRRAARRPIKAPGRTGAA